MMVWLLILLMALGAPASAFASWAPLGEQVFISPSGHYRLQITPGQSGQRCVGRLSYIGRDGKAALVWHKQFSNTIAPAGALVRDDGKYVVTMDEYGGNHFGSPGITIYGAHGGRIQFVSLEQFAPEGCLDRIPHEQADYAWRGSARFLPDHETVLLGILVRHDPDLGRRSALDTLWTKVRLLNGEVIRP